MKIAILGAGAIGSIFAYQLSRAGHDVTVIARNSRLAALRKTGGISVRHLLSGKVDWASVQVSDALSPSTAWDLLLVPVQRQQVDSLVDVVAASSARRIMFMFNTAGDIASLRDRVGRDRFLWGFPAALGALEGGAVRYEVVPSWLRFLQITTIGGLADYVPPDLQSIRELFVGADIPTALCTDMSAWLKTHAAFMVPLMAAGVLVNEEGTLPWEAARSAANAMLEGFRLVRSSGVKLQPAQMAAASQLPRSAVAVSIWFAFQIGFVREILQAHVSHAHGEVYALLRDLRGLAGDRDSPALAALQRVVESKLKH